MKKSFLLTICAVALVFGVSSCGESSGDKTIAQITLNENLKRVVDVYGGEDDFFQPVAGIYPIIEKDGKWQVVIEFEKSKKTSSDKYTAEEFTLSPRDKDKNRIKVNNKRIEFNAENKHNILKELLSAQVGDHVKVTFTYIPTDDEKAQKEFLDKIFTCRIDLHLDKDEIENNDEEIADDEETEDVDGSDSIISGSSEIDGLLDDFERTMNKLLNTDVLSDDYDKIGADLERLNSNILKYKSKMSSAQLKRYNEIYDKL